MISPTTKSETDSLIVNVSVADPPILKLERLLYVAIVGGVVSAGTVLTVIETVLFASDPSTLKLPAASENLLLATLTTPDTLLLAAGVNVAV